MDWLGNPCFPRRRIGARKGAALEDYLNRKFDEATAQPGSDFFSALTQATFRGRPLRRRNVGFCQPDFCRRARYDHPNGGQRHRLPGTQSRGARLFAPGSGAHHARERESSAPSRRSPISGGLPGEDEVHGATVSPRGRVSLCWASANLDRRIFENPDEVRLDRKPNPHVAFGFGTHLCLGAPHARLILRTLLEALVGRVRTITVLD